MLSFRRLKHAFTLVELLVVIGIIAILIGVLLPALSAARRQANTAACLSNMRQLGLSFQMYAGTFKNAMPVAFQDYPYPSSATKINYYWQDFMFPFIQTRFKQLQEINTDADFQQYRKSVLWCPVWEGWYGNDLYTFKFGVSRFETGYSMNMYPSFTSTHPNTVNGMVPKEEWSACGNSDHVGVSGRYYKKHEWTDPANRMLVVDSNFWLFNFTPTDANGTLASQLTTRNSATGTGATQIDRYRHGKPPPVNAGVFSDKGGGRVAYNILYVDGHAVTSNSIQDGYKAIRMRYP